MVDMDQPRDTALHSSLADMIATITKTFVIAHDQDSDEHLAQALVFNAGRLAWRMREQGVSTDFKTSLSDVVTDADRAAEQFVTGAISALRPEDGILGEEGTHKAGTSGRTWVIDPVDGTYNFISGSDYWCSALALVEGDPAHPDKVCFGAVHRPAMGYTWFGGKDIPTTRDGKALPALENKSTELISMATYLNPPFIAEPALLNAWLSLAQSFLSWRMIGAGSVDLGGVADGALGAYVQHTVQDWDWLPGRALVEGVGGTCIKVEAAGVTWCIAANPQAADEIATILRTLPPAN
ncbi:fructose-1 6-bisphosphatase [Corynebacterium ulcerans NCTC 12077]|uniref:inositol monophosphatase family protein n=1 Tax=Corynebacterium ulcerans TaxID=65058 RepID=UPI0003C7C776|nr:inositol monophosphatase family protein [Corynebacterium ulcerans]ESU59028.1 fructose-1 6-bisphosphatase [Corynebacterium ulcerans NCTC 12077]